MTILYQTKMCESDRDEIDRLPSKDRVTNWDIAGFIISIISHIVDIFFDCNLAYRYYINHNLGYFFTTLAFILVPAFINTAFSIRMYVSDNENKNRGSTLTKKFTKRTLCCLVVLIFQLAPVLRYFDALTYARRSKKAEKEQDHENQRKYYELMVKEDSDVALLRVLECFLEAAPQQILQLTIIFYTHGEGISDENPFTLVHQLLSIGSSFASMAWSMASYQRLLRVSLKNKNNISWAGTIVQFMWHFLVTVSRILSITIMFHIYPFYTSIGVIIHWLVMTIWIFFKCKHQNNFSFCDHNVLLDFCFSAVLGVVYIFELITVTKGRTRIKYTFFYIVMFLEFAVSVVFWFIAEQKGVLEKHFIIFSALLILPFAVGIIYMILYYIIFHPNKYKALPVSYELFSSQMTQL